MALSSPTLILRPATEADYAPAAALLEAAFLEVAVGKFTPRANALFLQFNGLSGLWKRRNQHDLWLAFDNRNGAMAGMMEIKPPYHLTLVFVDPAFKGQGVARQLVLQAIYLLKSAHPRLSQLNVNAFPFRQRFYERMGFVLSGEATRKNGIPVQPMKFQLVPDSFYVLST